MSLKEVAQVQDVDVLIVGGGLVGASFALALASQDSQIQVVMVEAVEAASDSQPSFDDRSTVLSKSSANLFADMGLWDCLSGFLAPIEHIHTSERGQFGFSRLHAADYEVDAMGYVVDNKCLGTQLYAQLAQYANIRIISPAQVASVNVQAQGCQVHVRDTQQDKLSQYQAKLVVICDGGRSELAQQLGIDCHTKSYEQAAVIANIELQKAHEGWAYERFTQQGPIAMLPLPNFQGKARSALVWTTPISQLDERLAQSDDDFLAELQAQFGHRLGRLKGVGARGFYPLKIQHSQELVRSRLAMLGNAAYTLHPVAGQGFNLALRGAALLAYHVLSARAQGADIGALSNLQAFSQAQQADAKRIQHASHGLVSVFAPKVTSLKFARNLGILALDHCPLLKGSFARAAMGLDVKKPTIRQNP